MVDTTTTVYGFVLQTIGGNRNTWGGINNDNFSKVETALSGQFGKVVTGGSYTVTEEEARNRVLYFAGGLASTQTIVLPVQFQQWVVVNDTVSNGFGLVFKTASGTPVNVPNGTYRTLLCFGAVHLFRDDLDRVGEVFHWGGASVPAWAIELDGVDKVRADYPSLFAAWGTTWGPGNGATTFGIPNEKTTGRFRRSRTASVAAGTTQSNTNKAHSHSSGSSAVFAALSVTGSDGAHSHAVTGDGTHAHSGTTDGTSVTLAHTHDYDKYTPGTATGGQSGASYSAATAGSTSVPSTGGVAEANNTLEHNHAFSIAGTQGGHSHGTDSHAGHTHSLSATITLTIGSDGDTEARPEAIVYIACARY